jgi:hypothetical protein
MKGTALPDTEFKGFPCEYHSDADGDRYVLVDAEDHDLTGWSVEVGKSEQWHRQAGFGGWAPELDGRTDVREFTNTRRWYRTEKGSPWGHIRYSRDEVDHPWSALVDHGEAIIRWIPPAVE